MKTSSLLFLLFLCVIIISTVFIRALEEDNSTSTSTTTTTTTTLPPTTSTTTSTTTTTISSTVEPTTTTSFINSTTTTPPPPPPPPSTFTTNIADEGVSLQLFIKSISSSLTINESKNESILYYDLFLRTRSLEEQQEETNEQDSSDDNITSTTTTTTTLPPYTFGENKKQALLDFSSITSIPTYLLDIEVSKSSITNGGDSASPEDSLPPPAPTQFIYIICKDYYIDSTTGYRTTISNSSATCNEILLSSMEIREKLGIIGMSLYSLLSPGNSNGGDSGSGGDQKTEKEKREEMIALGVAGGALFLFLVIGSLAYRDKRRKDEYYRIFGYDQVINSNANNNPTATSAIIPKSIMKNTSASSKSTPALDREENQNNFVRNVYDSTQNHRSSDDDDNDNDGGPPSPPPKRSKNNFTEQYEEDVNDDDDDENNGIRNNRGFGMNHSSLHQPRTDTMENMRSSLHGFDDNNNNNSNANNIKLSSSSASLSSSKSPNLSRNPSKRNMASSSSLHNNNKEREEKKSVSDEKRHLLS